LQQIGSEGVPGTEAISGEILNDPVLTAILRQQGFDSMSECDDSVDKTALPGEQAQRPQPIQSGSGQKPAAHSSALLAAIIDDKGMSRQGAGRRTFVLDHARFTAGIVGLYEAVLNEPIPERMLRLIEEIGKQERKS